MTPILSIIVAADEQGAIGLSGAMPWHLPADLRYFKQTTLGHPVVMGRKTYEAIGRPLPGRRNVVISRQADYVAEGCEVCRSIEEALSLLPEADEVFIIGGAQIYRQAWQSADRLYLTRVHTTVPAFDASIPAVDRATWRLSRATECAADERNAYDVTFELYERQR
jgi:dihydrofolate reductase